MAASVKDVMTRNVVGLRKDTEYKAIVSVIRRRHISAFPVLDDHDHVVGVVSEADLLLKQAYQDRPSGSPRSLLRRRDRAKAAALTAADLMTSPAVTIVPEATVAEAAQVMHGRKLKRLPVVDSAGRLVGIVSRVDLLGVYDRPDQEIWNEITREVIGRRFALDPQQFNLTVAGGVVTITGQAESLDEAEGLLDAIWEVGGVVDVRDRLSYPSR